MAHDEPSNPGEVREDIPLRPSDSHGFAHKFGGVRLIIASFTIITAAVTVALAIQIYKGDYEVVPHGGVATDSHQCSNIGTDILKAGGNSVDAAIAATFCLAVVNPHSTGLDATGTMMYYDYRKSRTVGILIPSPIVVEFSDHLPSNIPQLVKGLAFIHDRFGTMEWSDLVMPAADLARSGFSAPISLLEAVSTVGNSDLFKNVAAGNNLSLPSLAIYLNKIAKMNSTSFIPEPSVSDIATSEAMSVDLDGYTIYFPLNFQATNLIKFLNSTYTAGENQMQLAKLVYRIAYSLNLSMEPTADTASSVSVIDKDEVYVSLITGLHTLLGAQTFNSDGFIPNTLPKGQTHKDNEFLPTIITSRFTCGLRIVLSCGDASGTAQVINTLLQETDSPTQLAVALESPRLHKLANNYIAYEKNHAQVYPDIVLQTVSQQIPLTTASQPYPTCNAVQQFVDSLLSHSDSRGGGLASRF